MDLKPLNTKPGVIFVAAALMPVILFSCSVHNTMGYETKNVADYFNLLSEQKFLKGRIVYDKGNYTLKIDGCYEGGSLNVNLLKNSIYYMFTDPCAGPPPVYSVTLLMAVSNDKTVYVNIKSEEKTFGDKESDFFKFNGAVFEKVSIKTLPAEVSERFRY